MAKHLITGCLLNPAALGDSTRILITHNLEILSRADLVIVMDSGSMAQKGTYGQLTSTPGLFRQLIKQHGQTTTEHDHHHEESQTGNTLANSTTGSAVDTHQATAVRVIEDEERVVGGVTWATYWRYGKAVGGTKVVIALLVTCVFVEASDLGMRIFLGYWSAENINKLSSAGYSVSP